MEDGHHTTLTGTSGHESGTIRVSAHAEGLGVRRLHLGSIEPDPDPSWRLVCSLDSMLDLLVAPDRSWTWKDENELEVLVNPGPIQDAEARQVRDEARPLLGRARANEPPFCEPWHDWHPDPLWAPPGLPHDWRIVNSPA